MATTEIHAVNKTLGKAIKYIVNPKKTEQGLYVNSYGCTSDPDEAAAAFLQIRNAGTGRGKTLAQHLHQSFAPGEVTPDEAMKIGMELAEKYLKGEYQFVIATHVDKEHIHNHIIFNNVNYDNGRTFEYLENRGSQKWKRLREISDQICQEHGLSIVENPEKGKGKCWFEWQQNKEGLSWKAKLKSLIDDAVMHSDSFANFLMEMDKRDVDVVYRPDLKVSLKFRLREGQQKYTRAKTLGWYYEPKQIEKRIRDYLTLRSGVLPFKQRTKIINTHEGRFLDAAGLQRWADIQNMKEASKMINFLTENGIQSQGELEEKAIAEYGKRIALVGELNHIQRQIDALTDTIAAIRTYRKYKPVHDGYLNAVFKKKYQSENASALKKYEGARDELDQQFPDHKLPKLETISAKRDQLIATRKEKNQQYKQCIEKIKEYDYARTTLDDYLKQNDRSKQKEKESLE